MNKTFARMVEAANAFDTRFPSVWPAIRVVGPFIPLILLWDYIAKLQIWPLQLFPPPSWVIKSAVDLVYKGVLPFYLETSLYRLAVGFAIAVGVAIPLGMAMGLNKNVAEFFEPAVNFFQSIAEIAWIPLALVWFGFGFKTMLFIIIYTVFFPVVFNTMMGVKGVPRVLEEAALTCGAKRWRVIMEVLLPGSLPSIMTGLRLGMGYGWRALIAAEMIVGEDGLGYMIFEARKFNLTEQVMLGMIMMGLLWLITDRFIMKPLENKTIERWGLVRADS
jgi:NitT/TauT family transport system permease protein/taurine transport system permease protein